MGNVCDSIQSPGGRLVPHTEPTGSVQSQMGEIEKHQHVSRFLRLDKLSDRHKMYPVNHRTGEDKYAHTKLLKIWINSSDEFGRISYTGRVR